MILKGVWRIDYAKLIDIMKKSFAMSSMKRVMKIDYSFNTFDTFACDSIISFVTITIYFPCSNISFSRNCKLNVRLYRTKMTMMKRVSSNYVHHGLMSVINRLFRTIQLEFLTYQKNFFLF